MGEKAIVELARKTFRRGEIVKVGIGDDAAVLDVNGTDLVVTTDMFIAGTHFPAGTSPEHMAMKAVAATISDLAAMGSKPLGMLFSVALPRNLDYSFVKRMLKTIDRAARSYGAYVIGGDLDESKDITIAGVALGLTHGRTLLRSGAKAGDLVAVTGTVGNASAGLEILLKKLPRGGFQKLVIAQLEPRARVREGEALAKSGLVNSAIDLSDGLASNLWQLTRESKVKVTINRGLVPEDPLLKKFCKKYGRTPDDFVLFGGEDFELLFTVKPRGWKSVSKTLQRLGTKAIVIGRVEKGRGVYLKKNGKCSELLDKGYEHFR